MSPGSSPTPVSWPKTFRSLSNGSTRIGTTTSTATRHPDAQGPQAFRPQSAATSGHRRRHGLLTEDGWQFSRHRAHFFPRLANHYRLFRRLRRRLQSTAQPILHTSHKLHALTVLRDLTKHTRASFDAARHLRSDKYTDLEVYAICRMATSLEEPGRSRALHLLNQALTYRNLTPPKSNLPLTIPFLAHPSFQSDVQRWLAQLINHHKHFAIPLHLPTCRVREAAHPTLRSRLHNHRRWETLLGSYPDIDQLPCGCAHLRTLLLPTSQFPDDDHLIVTLADLQLPVHLRRLLNANMNSTFFPTKQCYFDSVRKSLIKWLRHHGLPTTLSLHVNAFLTTQWKHHNLQLHHEDRFTARSVKHLQEFLGLRR